MVQEDKKPPEIEITNSLEGSAYSQLVSITITDIDTTLEFAYINPREKKGQIVSRITMPHPAGINLAKAIYDTMKLHEAQKKGKQNG